MKNFTILLLALFALMTFNVHAQTTCTSALNAAIGTNQAPAQTEVWYKFSVIGQPSANYLVRHNGSVHDSLSVEVFSGSCNSLTLVSLMGGGGTIPAVPNDSATYYIRFLWHSTIPRTFEWELFQDLGITATAITVTPEIISMGLDDLYNLKDLTVIVLPANASETGYDFTTIHKEVLELPANTGTIYEDRYMKAIGTGTAELVFTTRNGGFKDTVMVQVSAPSTCSLATTASTGTNNAQAIPEEWFHFTPVQSGFYTISHSDYTSGGNEINANWKIYKGDCDNLQQLSDFDGKLFQAEAGQLYSIRLLQTGLTAFNWTLNTPIPVTGFSLSTKQLELTLSEEGVSYRLADLGINFTPSDATNQGIDIVVRDTTILALYQDGKDIVYQDSIRAFVKGSTYVIFTTRDGGFKDSCLVTIKGIGLNSFSISTRQVDLYTPYNYGYNPYYSSGDTLNIADLGLNFSPANATDKSFTATIRQKGIVRHMPYGMMGYLQANREGSTYVVLTTNDGNLKDSVLINVTRALDGGSACNNAVTAQMGDNTQPAGEGVAQWYIFTPSESGNYAFTNHTSQYPLSHLDVYEGTCNELYLVTNGNIQGGYESTGSNQFDCGELLGYQVGFYGEAGKTYYLKLNTLYYNLQGGAFDGPVSYPWTLGKVSASVSGTVTDNGSPAQGKVELYALDNGKYTMLQTATIQADGSYIFNNLGVESYTVKAITTAGNITYLGDTLSSRSAFPIRPVKSETLTGMNIVIAHQTQLNEGTAIISGYVFNSEDTQQAPAIRKIATKNNSSTPAEGVTILLQRNGATIAYIQTNNNGYFQFTGVGVGEYAVVIDIPGMEMEEESLIIISEEGQEVGINYEVNDAGISETSDITDIITADKTIAVYPNPVSNILHIATVDGNIPTVKVYNLTGMLLLQTQNNSINVSELVSGVYLLDINGVRLKVLKK